MQKIATKKAAEAEAEIAALTPAADGDAITKNNAEAAEATVAAKAQDEDEEILALIQERKVTEKHDKERIREISTKIKKCIREKKGRQGKKHITEDIERIQRNKEHLQHQDGKKANPHPKDQKQKRRNHQHKRRHCECIR